MPRYDFECQICGYRFEDDCASDQDEIKCLVCESGFARKVFTKMPLRSYLKRPQDRLWGTSHISSSEKFKEKQKRKGGKK